MVLVADLSEYNHEHLAAFEPDKIAGFILSTYGDGDPPDNTNGFWRTLQRFLENGTSLDKFQYFIFGLGNRNYRSYNRVAEVVDASLQKLQAQRIGPAGCADESNGGTVEDFLSWKQDIAQILQNNRNWKESIKPYHPSLDVSEISDLSVHEPLFLGEPDPSLLRQQATNSPDTDVPFVIPISRIRDLYSIDDRTCIHFEFSLQNLPRVKYQTGDHLAIWPMNPDLEVERLFNILGLEQKTRTTISIKSHESSSRRTFALPTITTIEALFRYYLEICAPLSRDMMASLVEFAPGPAEKEYLQILAFDRPRFEMEVLATHRTLAGLLTQINGQAKWNIPLSFLIERLRKMQPRRYSISSSAITQPRLPSVTVAVDTTHLKCPSYDNTCHGLATNYLFALRRSMNMSEISTASLKHCLTGPRNVLEGTKVFGQIRRSTFKLPPKESTPVILVGAGTGIAPLHAFVQERARLKRLGRHVGRVILIMGFRKPDEDFLYREEWRDYQNTLGEENLRIWTAFSRETPSRKIYVQDKLRENAGEVFQTLEQDDRSSIYICGSARMARDVLQELKYSWAQRNHRSVSDSGDWLTALKRSTRLHEDIWG